MNEQTTVQTDAKQTTAVGGQVQVPAMRLALPPAALKRLAGAGIHCRNAVSLETQHKEKRAVLRGVESGGATRETGHYILFSDERGKALAWLQPMQSILANGLHAVVIAESMTSVEMFRYENTYELLITRHKVVAAAGVRAQPERRQIFRGNNGYLPLDLTGADAPMKGHIVPEFFTRSGERRDLPAALLAAIRAATAAVNTLNCRQALFAKAPQMTPEADGA